MTEPKHTLYRFFDAKGYLLYVGRTIAPAKRLRQHERGAEWYDEVATTTRVKYPDAASLDAAEREAIATEGPIHNIALNSRRAATKVAPVAPTIVIVDFPDEATSHEARLKAISDAGDPAPTNECEGVVEYCECAACHRTRLLEFEEALAKYDWHPGIYAEIKAVVRDYYSGAYLPDWYYDWLDIEVFARINLRIASNHDPLPAMASIENSVAAVECPFCFGSHQHFLSGGMSLDRLQAPCADSLGTGYYALVTDWEEAFDGLHRWAARAERAA